MALDIRKFIQRFIEEARDHLSNMGEGLAALEQGGGDAELINGLFRSAHTIKGSSRMLKLVPVTETAHSLEDLLSALREQRVSASPGVCSLLYQGVDALTDLVEQLTNNPDPAALTPVNSQLCQALKAAAEEQQLLSVEPAASASVPEVIVAPEVVQEASNPALRTSDTVRIRLSKLEELIKLMGEVVSSHAGFRELVDTARQLDRRGQLEGRGELPAAWHQFTRNLRETVIAQEDLMQELHDKALQMRMLPLNIVFEPASRLVRDLARSLGKQVECRIRGAEIELDRQMIDQLADPVIHLLRNALDHGIETPEARQAKGKPSQGLVSLSARQDGGWVELEISDDGAGISLEAIRSKALKKELVTPEQLETMSDQEVMDLIFLPGFSTSAMITELSGRGVGMDVVKRSIVDGLQGVISMHSTPGEGSRFVLRLPLSLAMMRVLLVQSAGHQVGFTAQYVAELISMPETALINVADRNAVIIRNEFVPVVNLAELIGLPALPEERRLLPRTEKDLLLLVTRVHHEKLALVVDELLDERDLVIKQLPEHLRDRPMIAGMVTTGHNRLVSLLHVPCLMDMARRSRQPSAVSATTAKTEKQRRILVVDDSLNTREIERDVLEAWGYQVTLAENGQDGLDKALADDFDAVLTDVEMPVMDGFTLTARLRQDERYSNRPIVIITSREKESDRRRGIEVGADAYIVKGSFDQNSLVDTLRVLLD
ncbi:hybrid sensor histidine kinase/response regulator [Marinospirillum alkaliphilum]|uniref:Chemotaxis protein CheA n=1 Tax=Marinospirillum alkaliphilum DSM 21637 TaxID=1122209 RepID=A0A1K1XR82_9GAMM|nr:response regulator [Marinospirillum alkaliphilum]SFX52241.1 two-component system, chemotaxis family, sensor kinase CheA [Marinospirillum alkaliphilum DSM 21637]